MAVTLRDIAERCNVSRAAVSQVLRNPEHQSFPEATRQRILRAAEDLNYVRNRLGVSLRHGRTGLLGLVCRYHGPEMVDMAQRTASRLGYGLLIQFTPDMSVEAEAKVIRATLELQVDGLIWQPWGPASDYVQIIDQIEQSRAKVAVLERRLPGLTDADTVLTDFDHGITLGLEHLLKRGYRSVVYATYEVAGKPVNELFVRRMEFFGDLVRQHGLEPHFVYAQEGGLVQGKGLESARVLEMIRKLPGPVGFMCNSDWLAIELSEIALAHDVDIPQDMGIVAWGDMLFGNEFRVGSLVRPRLTAVQIPAAQKMLMAVEMLVERLKPKEGVTPARTKTLDMTLVERESTDLQSVS